LLVAQAWCWTKSKNTRLEDYLEQRTLKLPRQAAPMEDLDDELSDTKEVRSALQISSGAKAVGPNLKGRSSQRPIHIDVT